MKYNTSPDILEAVERRMNELLYESGIEAYGHGDPEPLLSLGHDPYYRKGWLEAQRQWQQLRFNFQEDELPC